MKIAERISLNHIGFDSFRECIALEHEREDRIIIVLDDDPTGTQTVHDVDVITEWSHEQLQKAFFKHVFFILTNSRSLSPQAAHDLVAEICTNIREVAEKLNRPYVIVTRSDSTLRGHFEEETEAVREAINEPNAMTVFAPAFLEADRLTRDNVHYIKKGEEWTPVAESEFAHDKSFGYKSSHLYEYVLEKSNSIGHKDEIFDLSLTEIRLLSPNELVQKVIDNAHRKVLIVNACDASDLQKVALVLMCVQNRGLPIVIRSGASLVSALAGIAARPLLSKKEMNVAPGAGLIVVGSYVDKTTQQLKYLLENKKLASIKLDVNEILEGSVEEIIERTAAFIDNSLVAGVDCVLYTSRALVSSKDAESSLKLVNAVSNGVISILMKVSQKPSFVIAKGGITSSDVATKALGIKHAKVLGQILTGVPVWEAGQETRFPGIPYVVFPGNVGSHTSLYEAHMKLTNNP